MGGLAAVLPVALATARRAALELQVVTTAAQAAIMARQGRALVAAVQALLGQTVIPQLMAARAVLGWRLAFLDRR